MADLRIFSLNVRGLRNISKRKKLFRMFKEKKYDVICLQETYVTKDAVEQWKTEWGGGLIYSEGTNHSRGQVILIKKQFPYVWSAEVVSERILVIKVTIGNKITAIVNAYAPCTSASTNMFFTNLTAIVNELEWEQKVVCGDFNAVMDNDLDIISGEKHSKPLVELFNNFVNECELTDVWRSLNPLRREFTWSKISQNKLLARRLDYVFLNDAACNIVTNSDIHSVPTSDHRGILVALKCENVRRGPGYWKFNNNLLKEKAFVEKINKIIDSTTLEASEESAETRWEFLKLKIKNEAIQYSKALAIKNRNTCIDLQSRLRVCESLLANAPTDINLIGSREEIKLLLDFYEQTKLKSAQTRSKEKWIEEGERNTKYFLGLEKSRANAKLFPNIELDNGDIIVDQFDILKTQKNYYENIYGRTDTFSQEKTDTFLHNCNVPKLSDKEKNMCEGNICVEEASKALKMMKNGSSPGSDGITTEFYKMFWVKLGAIVTQSFNCSLENGHLSHTQTAAILTLLHKGKDLPKNKLSNWRPISLTNTDYKILAKCLSNRVCTVIDSIVHKDQVGYIKGRNVSTTIRTIDDVIEYFRLKEKPGILLALDFQRAFDSISKKFMLYAFKKFGFGSNFLKWVEVIFNNTRGCIGYNGWLSSDFEVKCGIRQGCPFSPLAFVIGIELLAIRFRQSADLKGLQISADDILKILLYADDITLFVQDENDVKHVLTILEKFAAISGLHLNMQKSEAMLIGSRRHENAKNMGFKWVKFIKILGVYFSNSKCASEIDLNWKDKLSKIKQIIIQWEKRKLGILGKICVIKSFLLSQFVYILQAISLPDKVLAEINTLLYRFIWRKRDCNRKAFEKVKRVVVNSEIEKGGIKMIDVKLLQESFLCRWMIKVSHADAEGTWTWIPKSLFQVFGRDCACFNTTVGPKRFKGLHLLKSVFWQRVALTWLNNTRIKSEGTPKMECLWNNNNIVYQNQVLYFHKWAQKGFTYVKDLLQDNVISSIDTISTILGTSPSLLLQYEVVYSAVSKFLIRCPDNVVSEETPKHLFFNGKNFMSAKFIRSYLVENTYSTPSAVLFWKNKFSFDINEACWSIAAKVTTEARLRELHWKILHNIYPTNILLKKMGIANSEMCPNCNNETDYIEHFFFNCVCIQSLWKHVENHIYAQTGCRVLLDKKCILLGIVDNITNRYSHYISHLILVGKMCISKYRFGTPIEITIMFDRELKLRNLMHLY